VGAGSDRLPDCDMEENVEEMDDMNVNVEEMEGVTGFVPNDDD
jgi:hypothetical protein